MRQAVTAREEDSNFQHPLGRERIPKALTGGGMLEGRR
jgi:hypothetical protein